MSPNFLAPGVYLEEQQAGSRPIQGVGTAVAAFLGLTQTGPVGTPHLVANWTAFRTLYGDFAPGCHLPRAVYAYFQNGGGTCYVVRVASDTAEPQARGLLPSAEAADRPTYEVVATAGGEGLSLSVETSNGAEDSEDEERFNLIVRRGDEELERFDGLTAGPGPGNVVATVNERSRLIRIAETGAGVPALPAAGTVELVAKDGARAGLEAFVGDAVAQTGLEGLKAVDDVTILATPDLVQPPPDGELDADLVSGVQLELIAHCEKLKDRMVILDTPPGLTAQAARAWRMKQGYDSPFAALYYPWVRVAGGPGGQTLMPPSGHVAGVWARSDATRGVHKAPANEPLGGVLDVERQITQEEQTLLNPVGVNVIRAFPARGVRIWGARTTAPPDSEWRYVNVRRLLNFLEESIVEGTQWVVFEPNDPRVWQRIIRSVSAFLTLAWRDGALFGRRPEDAFYVKCDAENNPPEVIDAGQVVIDVGVAPVKPAEFVYFRVAQLSAGADIQD